MSPKPPKRPSPAFIDEAGRWLAFAKGDQATALAFVKSTTVPNRNSAYMAQQAAEEALKSVILLDGLPFEMVHDLDAIAAQVPADFVVPVEPDDLAWLTDLESNARYPDEGDVITQDDARRAVDLSGLILAAAEARFSDRGIDPAGIAVE